MNKCSETSHHQSPKCRLFKLSSKSNKKPKISTTSHASVFLKPLGLPLISKTSSSPCTSLLLESYKPYTIGRCYSQCDFVFDDIRVSKVHCQMLFDSMCKKIYLSDGLLFSFIDCNCSCKVKVSLNGVFINQVRIREGEVVELCVGDEVALVHGNECVQRLGFVVERIVFVEDMVGFDWFGSSTNHEIFGIENFKSDAKASVLVSMCREILCSKDPIGYIRKSCSLDNINGNKIRKRKRLRNFLEESICKTHAELSLKDCIHGKEVQPGESLANTRVTAGCSYKGTTVASARINGMKWSNSNEITVGKVCSAGVVCENGTVANGKHEAITAENTEKEDINLCENGGNAKKERGVLCKNGPVANGRHEAITVENTEKEDFNLCENGGNAKKERGVLCENGTVANGKHEVITVENTEKEDINLCENGGNAKKERGCPPAPGRKFYLNKLQDMDKGTMKLKNVVALTELLYPVESLVKVFIATFTSDIPWFLSYCEIPPHLPVTIARHDRERCWSSSPEKRISMPYSDFPHLAVVYPPFPEAIAFGQDSKKMGIACHHPKLFLLQREDSLRVVITSANLVEKQWLKVTNTVWWQDFPRLRVPDYVALFGQSSYGDRNSVSKADFAAHLAGFIASLVADVPCQSHWVMELAKFNFNGALAHLVASIPGIYSARSRYLLDSRYSMHGNQHNPTAGAKLLGSVEASLVGLSYLFRTSADSNGKKLRKLAEFLGKCRENADGMAEVLLRREKNIPADANAVGVLLPNPKELSGEDCIQLGFLPRNCAKWVASLSDVGLFAFSAYVYPKEVLKAALEGSNNKVHLVLYVSQGPSFSEITRVEHLSAVCSLVASIQRCVGLWRLQEVLCQYKWPEHLESDFIFGSSSVGSVNAHFLAAFSAAAGKRLVPLTESEESDPDWGCWSASQELRNPSIRIIFPTIERVKTAHSGIWASKYLLCFSQKTWHRLKRTGILDDAIPYPNDREGFPMHVKVARRRFYSKNGDASFGWVYCGSHNFSAAAWGRPLSKSLNSNAAKLSNSSILGSRLHVSNYELGIIFTVSPSDGECNENGQPRNLDEIVLPFITPAPKYRPWDRPATPQAMREALAEVAGLDKRGIYATVETIPSEEEVPDEEEEVLEVSAADFIRKEKEDETERAYADKLWSQVGSFKAAAQIPGQVDS